MEFICSIDEVVDTLRGAKDRRKQCSLLIGAGCSVKAGIPTAQGFVKLIAEKYPRDFAKAKKKTYPHCMAQLSRGERKDLIAEYVDKAKINWAHIGIAQLMAHGYVDRVLTTNFDPLVVRACSLVNQFPAVYDLASSQLFKPEDVHHQAVFHLHGQRTGFAILNTESECEKHSKLLAPVFQDAGKGRVWLVVGYSGESDPVFDHLAGVPEFDNRLYWVGYMDNEPAPHVRERLLMEGKYAFYVKGFDADDFFTTLARKLDCFPPGFCAKPFSHLEACLDTIAPYPMPGQKADLDVTSDARNMIEGARKQYEESPEVQAAGDEKEPISPAKLMSLVMAGEYDQVTAMGVPGGRLISRKAANAVSWAYVMQGVTLCGQAKQKSGDEADDLFALAGEKYKAALEIKPDMHEALYNWGVALLEQAKQKSGDEADDLFALAGEKYKAALEIKPDKHEALGNWGVALLEQAKQKSGDEADDLFALAGEKYKAALEIKPDMHEALYNWGVTLGDQAKQKSGDEADDLFALAGEKYKAVLEIKPDEHEALGTWGVALLEQAKQKSGEEADALSALAEERFLQADSILPGYGCYDLACLNALRGTESECRAWLEKCRDHGQLPSREHIETDTDIDSVRDTDWFKEFIASL